MRTNLVWAVLTLLATSVAAQETPSKYRSPFWLSVGASQAWVPHDRSTGISPNVRVGVGVSRRLGLGAELTGFRARSPYSQLRALGSTERAIVSTANVYWYPVHGLYLKAGAGRTFYSFTTIKTSYAGYSETPPAETRTDKTIGAMAATVGMGVDIQVARHLTLSPYANYFLSVDIPGGDVISQGGWTSRATRDHNLFQGGLALTIR